MSWQQSTYESRHDAPRGIIVQSSATTILRALLVLIVPRPHRRPDPLADGLRVGALVCPRMMPTPYGQPLSIASLEECEVLVGSHLRFQGKHNEAVLPPDRTDRQCKRQGGNHAFPLGRLNIICSSFGSRALLAELTANNTRLSTTTRLVQRTGHFLTTSAN
jgi:hypothetical protein